MSKRRLHVSWVAIVTTLTMTASCSSAGSASSVRPSDPTISGDRTSATATATVVPTPGVASTLGPAPSGCPGPSPHPQRAFNKGPYFGASPLLGGFYARLAASENAFHADQAPHRTYGWRIKVLWAIPPNEDRPVTLSGHIVGTGQPILIDLANEPDQPRTSQVLDPSHPGIPVAGNGWAEFPSYLYFPRAECYVLNAQWQGGQWTLGFGFGR